MAEGEWGDPSSDRSRVAAPLGRYFLGVAITVLAILSQYFVPELFPASTLLYGNLPGDVFVVYGIPIIAFTLLVAGAAVLRSPLAARPGRGPRPRGRLRDRRPGGPPALEPAEPGPPTGDGKSLVLRRVLVHRRGVRRDDLPGVPVRVLARSLRPLDGPRRLDERGLRRGPSLLRDHLRRRGAAHLPEPVPNGVRVRGDVPVLAR